MRKPRRILRIASFAAICATIGALLSHRFWPSADSLEEVSRPAAMVTLSGSRVPAIQVLSDDGDASAPWEAGERSSVVFVFRVGCIYCDLAAPQIAALASDGAGQYSVFALSLTGYRDGREWLDSEHLAGVPVLAPADLAELRKSWSIRGTPLTLVIDAKGQVLFEKYGVLSEQNLALIRRLLRSA